MHNGSALDKRSSYNTCHHHRRRPVDDIYIMFDCRSHQSRSRRPLCTRRGGSPFTTTSRAGWRGWHRSVRDSSRNLRHRGRPGRAHQEVARKDLHARHRARMPGRETAQFGENVSATGPTECAAESSGGGAGGEVSLLRSARAVWRAVGARARRREALPTQAGPHQTATGNGKRGDNVVCARTSYITRRRMCQMSSLVKFAGSSPRT